MISKLKKLLTVALATFALGAPIMVPAMVSAAPDNNTISGACAGVNLDASKLNKTTGGNSSECGTVDDNGDKLGELIKFVINIFSLVVGVVAVIMIIIGGLKYITSGGDSGNITGAKNTILYAIVGLVVVGLAQFIVRFVLTKVGKTVGQ